MIYIICSRTHRFQFIFGLVELLDELAVEERLVQHDLLEADSEPLEVVVDPLQGRVELKVNKLHHALCN